MHVTTGDWGQLPLPPNLFCLPLKKSTSTILTALILQYTWQHKQLPPTPPKQLLLAPKIPLNPQKVVYGVVSRSSDKTGTCYSSDTTIRDSRSVTYDENWTI